MEPMHLPTTRRPWTAAITASAALALAAALGACGSDAAATAGDDPTHEHGDAADDGDGVFDIRTTEFTFLTEPSVTAGSVTVRLTNDGAEPHQVHFARVPDGVDPGSIIDLFEDEGERAMFEAVEWVGGIAGVEPGEVATAVVELEPGEYVLWCFLPSPDGVQHVARGMVSTLHVEGPEDGDPPVTTPGTTPEEIVVLDDYSIAVPAGFRGQGEVAFRNEGEENHEVILLRFRDGKTIADLIAWQADPQGPAPYTFANGMATIAPGTTATATLDLQPGDYLATCMVQSPDGTPHLDLGMAATFTVG